MIKKYKTGAKEDVAACRRLSTTTHDRRRRRRRLDKPLAFPILNKPRCMLRVSSMVVYRCPPALARASTAHARPKFRIGSSNADRSPIRSSSSGSGLSICSSSRIRTCVRYEPKSESKVRIVGSAPRIGTSGCVRYAHVRAASPHTHPYI